MKEYFEIRDEKADDDYTYFLSDIKYIRRDMYNSAYRMYIKFIDYDKTFEYKTKEDRDKKYEEIMASFKNMTIDKSN